MIFNYFTIKSQSELIEIQAQLTIITHTKKLGLGYKRHLLDIEIEGN